MCAPAALAVMAAVGTAVSVVGQYQSAKAQVKAIDQQNEIQAQEIADAAGVEMTERARAARRERAAMRTRGAEAGINLGTGSFLDALQTSVLNQHYDQGLILRNESNQQRARDAQARSLMSRIQVPTALSGALAIGTSAVSGYTAGLNLQTAGQVAATG
jgi:hypothetical protein